MSTLEKAIGLLHEMPERKLEAVYMYMCFVYSQELATQKSVQESSAEERRRGFQGLLSFAGTLPEGFDYKKELEEMRADFSTSDIPAITPSDFLERFCPSEQS